MTDTGFLVAFFIVIFLLYSVRDCNSIGLYFFKRLKKTPNYTINII